MPVFFWVGNVLHQHYTTTVPEGSHAAVVGNDGSAGCYQRVGAIWKPIVPSRLPIDFKAVLALHGYKL